MVSVSIVIRTMFKRSFLKDILAVLNNQIKKGDEIIIVNDSREEVVIPDYIKKYGTKVFKSEKHGYAQARNAGIAHATKEIIAFLDDDCLPESNWLIEIKKTYVQSKDIGGVGGSLILYRDEGSLRKMEELGMFLTDFLFGDRKAVGKIHPSGLVTGNFDPVGDIREVDHLNGSNLSFRRKALEGIWADEYFGGVGYREETDVCVNVTKRGYKLIFNPKAVVHHHIGQTRRTKGSLYSKHYNHYYFWKKNFKFSYIFFVRELLEAFLLILGGIFTFNKSYFAGVKGKIDGLREFVLK